MKPRVSIVVPIYNVENYLGRCLDSLLSQTLSDIEIIAVNDGSTDSSREILTQYSKKDKRIKVINKENAGVSSARNEGINAATGDYIGFVDPDDWVELDMYKEMYELAIKENTDIVMCSYIREYNNHSKIKVFDLPEKVSYQYDEVHQKIMRRLVGPLNEEIANPELLDAFGTVWSKLYKSELIKNNLLLFEDLKRIGSNEDSLFNIHATYYANRFVFLNKPFYHYWRDNSGSITGNYNPKLISQFMELNAAIESFLNDKRLKSEFYKALNNRICLTTLGLGLNVINKNNKVSTLKKLKELNKILNNDQIGRSFKQFDLSYCSFVWKAFFLFAKNKIVIGYFTLLVTINGIRRASR